MKTWDDYKHYIQAVDTDAGQDLDEIEEQAAIISTMIQQRHALGLSQRELASLMLTFMPCGNIIISTEVNKKKGNYCGSN